MAHGRQTPEANQRRALVVHDQLVHGSLESVHLLLHCGHDTLNLLHALAGLSRTQLNAE